MGISHHSCIVTNLLADSLNALMYFALTCESENLQLSWKSNLTLQLVFASLRTYAIWNQNKVVLLCMLCVGLAYPSGYIVSVMLFYLSENIPD